MKRLQVGRPATPAARDDRRGHLIGQALRVAGHRPAEQLQPMFSWWYSHDPSDRCRERWYDW